MVRRLVADEVKQFVLDAGKVLVPEMSYWAAIDLEYLGSSWERLCGLPGFFAYGLTYDGRPVGLFLGMAVPDMNSGLMQGLEYFWGVQKKYRSKALGLLRLFESDCQSLGCRIIMLGSIKSMEPEDRRRLYARLGYEPHAEVFSKRLTHG